MSNHDEVVVELLRQAPPEVVNTAIRQLYFKYKDRGLPPCWVLHDPNSTESKITATLRVDLIPDDILQSLYEFDHVDTSHGGKELSNEYPHPHGNVNHDAEFALNFIEDAPQVSTMGIGGSNEVADNISISEVLGGEDVSISDILDGSDEPKEVSISAILGGDVDSESGASDSDRNDEKESSDLEDLRKFVFGGKFNLFRDQVSGGGGNSVSVLDFRDVSSDDEGLPY